MPVTIYEFLEHVEPHRLAPDYDGGCPCAEIEGNGFTVQIHCWRVCRICAYAGIHVYGPLSDGEALRLAAHALDTNPWRDSAEWEFHWEPRHD